MKLQDCKVKINHISELSRINTALKGSDYSIRHSGKNTHSLYIDSNLNDDKKIIDFMSNTFTDADEYFDEQPLEEMSVFKLLENLKRITAENYRIKMA